MKQRIFYKEVDCIVHWKLALFSLSVPSHLKSPAVWACLWVNTTRTCPETPYWMNVIKLLLLTHHALALKGGGPRVVVSTAAFHARVRGSVPGLGGLKETNLFLPHPRVKVSIVGSLRDPEVACSVSNFESCVWRTVSSQSSHHPQEVLLAQFSLYVHKGGLKPDSFHFLALKSDVKHHFTTSTSSGPSCQW